MKEYFINLNETVKKYFKVLSDEIPDFLYDYINTPAMQRIGKIGCGCGTDYTKIFQNKFFYSNLDHSIGVALIVWNFTKDKKQTLAGLFHDISTPVFKHCIDFMNGDHETQESTEELTTYMIKNSKEIMSLLERDNIKIDEVNDYHIYPIADNDTPRLSADRLEYTFTNGLYFKEVWNVEEIKEIYSNIKIQKNEEGIEELGFKDKNIAEKFIDGASKLWPLWVSNEDKLAMQFLADTVKKMSEEKFLTKKDLYTLSEQEVINRIENCKNEKIAKCFKMFENSTKINESDEPVYDKYCVSITAKRRYIVPLVEDFDSYKRINDISNFAKEKIDNYLQLKTKKYAYLDFNF